MENCFLYLALACVVQPTTACNAFRTSRPVEKLQDNWYILQWDSIISSKQATADPLTLKKRQCAYTNCFLTSNKRLLQDVTEFDAIIFNALGLSSFVPPRRSAKQKYVFFSWESSHYYPVCDSRFNEFFNWTWTYKLDSDLKSVYFKVYDLKRTEVGPRIGMIWSELGAVDNDTKVRLQCKSIAAAWFVSNCHDKSGRLEFVYETRKELERYGETIHIYGLCGDRRCPRDKADDCNRAIAKYYFFYFAFENSFAEDYVTEKVMIGLGNLAVPVVFGAANYSRFLPPESYLNARELGPAALAARMAAVISDYKRGYADTYYDFFRWRTRYSMESPSPEDFVCEICSALNNPEMMAKRTVHKNFLKWWNADPHGCTLIKHLLDAINSHLRSILF